MPASNPRLPLLACAALLLPALSAAQDGFPRRKPGLWDMSMEMSARAGMTMKSQQCVDEKTDQQAQNRALDQEEGARCEQRNVKRGAGSYEAEYSCQSARGKTEGKMKLSGDFNTRYTMDNQMRFDPPRGGMREGRMTVQAEWKGACPAGMKPGQMRMAGLPGGKAPGAGAMQGMTPEQAQQMQKMMEQMKQPQQGAGK